MATSGATGLWQLAGIVGTVLYRQLKHRLARERPFVSHVGICQGAPPLDRYSFPSGHTLHAVCFTLIATAHVPELAPILIPFTLLISASRVVLGLHYPPTSLAGALIGTALARVSLLLWPIRERRDQSNKSRDVRVTGLRQHPTAQRRAFSTW